MPGARRVVSAASACLAVALSLCSTASSLAGTVQAEPGTGLVFRAAPGEANDVTVEDYNYVDGVVWRSVIDLGAPLSTGPDCVSGPPVNCSGGPSTLYLGNRDDRGSMRSLVYLAHVYGEGGNDVIHSDGVSAYGYGGPGDDQVTVSAYDGYAFGGPGNDRLTGGAGEYNRLHGDAGDDVLVAGGGCPVLYGDGGADTLLGQSSRCSGAGLRRTQSGGTGPDALIVSSPPTAEQSWLLDGGDGADFIVGGGGGDEIAGGAGPDFIQAATDGIADTIACGAGRDTVRADALDSVAADCELVTRR